MCLDMTFQKPRSSARLIVLSLFSLFFSSKCVEYFSLLFYFFGDSNPQIFVVRAAEIEDLYVCAPADRFLYRNRKYFDSA
jgi:hypothetical protein